MIVEVESRYDFGYHSPRNLISTSLGVQHMEIDVQKVAMLARIKLTDDEATELGPQLSGILGYIDKLAEVNTEGVPATAHPHDAAMPLRANAVTSSNRRDELQVCAPKIESGLYVVPKVIE